MKESLVINGGEKYFQIRPDRNYTKEEALEQAIICIGRFGYIMTPDDNLLQKLEELEKEGLLIRADRAGERNPVKDCNDSYTFIEA